MPINSIQYRSTIGHHQQKVTNTFIDQVIKNNNISNRSNQSDQNIINFNPQLAEIQNITNNTKITYPAINNAKMNAARSATLLLAFLSQIRPGTDPLLTTHSNQFSEIYGFICDNNETGFTNAGAANEFRLLKLTSNSDSCTTVLNKIKDFSQQTWSTLSETVTKYDILTFPQVGAVAVENIPIFRHDQIYELQDEQLKNQLLNSLTNRNFQYHYDTYRDFLLPTIYFAPPTITPASLVLNSTASSLMPAPVSSDCHIRSKTNNGTEIGNALVVLGDKVNNPVTTFLDSVLPDGPRKDWQKKLLQLAELEYNIILNIVTGGGYGLIKSVIALSLQTSGNIVNYVDNPCSEFSSEEVTSFLLDTAKDLVERRIYPKHKVPKEIKSSQKFIPNGLFLQEKSGINMEKFLVTEHHGTEYMIREKNPGEFFTYHPYAVKPEQLENRVYFDKSKNKIHFSSEFPNGQGLDYKLTDGKRFISIFGEDRELSYDWDKKQYFIHMQSKKNNLQFNVPVYYEPLSKQWHMALHNNQAVFDKKESKILNKIASSITEKYHYIRDREKTGQISDDSFVHVYKAIAANDVFSHRVIEINGKIVPVNIDTSAKNGNCYYIYSLNNSAKKYPVEWDSQRWVFERATARQLSKQIVKMVTPQMYVNNIDISALSPPDHNSLRKDNNNNSYIRVNNNYIQLKKLNLNRYYIVDDLSRSKIILRLKNGRFFIETLRERLKNLLLVGLSGSSGQNAIEILNNDKVNAITILVRAGYTNESAVDLLTQYRFELNSALTPSEFALHIEQFDAIPEWASYLKRFSSPVTAINSGELHLGQHFGVGEYGAVFLDANDPNYVIKKFNDKSRAGGGISDSKYLAQQEADAFQRYYANGGDMTAEAMVLQDENDAIYIRMRKIPGTVLEDLRDNSLPSDALFRFRDMINKLENKKIIHADLHAGNVIWDEVTGTFNPIDITDMSSRIDELVNYQVLERRLDNLISGRENILQEIERKIADNDSQLQFMASNQVAGSRNMMAAYREDKLSKLQKQQVWLILIGHERIG